MSVLGFRQRRIDPDPTPAPEPHDRSHQRAFFENTAERDPICTCKAFDGYGQNPECDAHPWWRHDPAVLDLADLTRELGTAWDAARKQFGGER